MPEGPPAHALTVQMLVWLAARPRTYYETMDAWRTSCPRFSIWEDAVIERLVEMCPLAGAGLNGSHVGLTLAGQAMLDRARAMGSPW
jgi:hypothetical protein